MIDTLRQSLKRFLSFFRGKQLDKDLQAEMYVHLEVAVEENLRNGMSPDEARRQALIQFGGAQQATEQHRDSRGLPFLDVLFQDLRHTFRTLRKDRAIASYAVSQVIAALFFQTEPTDLMTFLSAAILLLFVALLAGYMPALRATQVDPMTALRSE